MNTNTSYFHLPSYFNLPLVTLIIFSRSSSPYTSKSPVFYPFDHPRQNLSFNIGISLSYSSSMSYPEHEEVSLSHRQHTDKCREGWPFIQFFFSCTQVVLDPVVFTVFVSSSWTCSGFHSPHFKEKYCCCYSRLRFSFPVWTIIIFTGRFFFSPFPCSSFISNLLLAPKHVTQSAEGFSFHPLWHQKDAYVCMWNRKINKMRKENDPKRVLAASL